MIGLPVVLLLIAMTILSPAEMFPAVAELRPIVVLTLLGAFASIPAFPRFSFKAPQFWLMLGFAGMIVFSRVVAQGRIGAGWTAFYEFTIFFAPFLFTVVNSTKLQHIRWTMYTLVLVGVVLSYYTLAAFYAGVDRHLFILDQVVWSTENEPVGILPRVRGLGFLADPNDLAQEMISLIPLAFVLWRRNNMPGKFTALFLSGLFLLVIYNTHSRGAMVGLAAMALVFLRKRVGNLMTGVAVLGLLGGAMVLNFGGGRAISVSGGSDRLEAWSNGLTMLKSSPVWGVGYEKFLSYADLTAHNSFVLCFAELGLVGYFFWLGTFYVCFRELATLMKPIPGDAESFEIARLARLLMLTMVAFLSTAIFLSRTYEVTLYVLVAMVVALAEYERRRPNPRVTSWQMQWAPQVVGLEFASIVLFYILVRLRIK